MVLPNFIRKSFNDQAIGLCKSWWQEITVPSPALVVLQLGLPSWSYVVTNVTISVNN